MKLFATAAELTKVQESLAAMELRATTAEAAVTDFTKQLDDLNAQIGALTAERDAAKAAFADAGAKVVDLTAKFAAKDAEVLIAKAGIDKQVAAQAAATVAALGHAAIPASTAATSGDDTMSRQQFNSVSALKQMQFIKSGGKVKDN